MGLVYKLVRTLHIGPNASNLHAAILQGALGSVLVKAGGIGLTFLVSLVLARLLGSSGYGAYAYAISWAMLLSVPAVAGLDVLLVREVAQHRALDKRAVLNEILRWPTRFVLVMSLLFVLAGAAGIWLSQQRFDSVTTASLWTALGVLPLLSLLRLQQGAIQGLGSVVVAQVPQVLLVPALLLILVSSLHLGRSLTAPSAIGAYIFSTALALFWSARWLRVRLTGASGDEFDVKQTRHWLRSTWPLFVVSTAGMLHDQVTVILLGTLADSEVAGIFDVSRKVAVLVSIGLVVIGMPLAPLVAQLHANGENARLRRLVVRSSRAGLLISLPIAVGLMILGRWVLSMFGEAFQAGYIALMILCLGQIVSVSVGAVALVLNMTGHARDAAQGIVLAALLNMVLSILLIPVLGLEGAAVASSVSLASCAILLAVRVYQRLGFRTASTTM